MRVLGFVVAVVITHSTRRLDQANGQFCMSLSLLPFTEYRVIGDVDVSRRVGGGIYFRKADSFLWLFCLFSWWPEVVGGCTFTVNTKASV